MALEVIDKGWKKVLKAAKAVDGKVITIGVDERARYPDGTPVAEVGYIHEHGIGVPQRPWMTELHDVTRDEQQEISRRVATLESPAQVERELERGADRLEREYKQRFDSLDLEPLKEVTISRKGSSQVLVDSGELRESIRGKVEEGSDAPG